MKKQHRLISFLLVLSLLFSSFIFTVNAEESEGIDNEFADAEFFNPTASYLAVTSSNLTSTFGTIFDKDANGNPIYSSPNEFYGNNDVNAYLVSAIGSSAVNNSYLMVVPTEAAVKNNSVPNHTYFDTKLSQTFSYDASQETYYISEFDIATESTLLPFKFQVVARNPDNASASYKDANGASQTAIDTWSTKYIPSEAFKSAIVPGSFHHVTFVGDVNNNKLYIFINNVLVDTLNDGITDSSSTRKDYSSGTATDKNIGFWQFFTTGNYRMRIDGMRVQYSVGEAVPADSSICIDNVRDRLLRGTDNVANLSDCIAAGNLSSWEANSNYSAEREVLPDLITVNGVNFNNTIDAAKALDTYKLGNEATMRRSCLSGSIVVNCDAVISTSTAEVTFAAGPDVSLTRGENNTWIGTLINHKFSANIVNGLENTPSLTTYVRYPALDNIISNIDQDNAVNGRTFSAEEYEDLKNDILQVIINDSALTDAEKTALQQSFDTDFLSMFTYNSDSDTYSIDSETISDSNNPSLSDYFKKAGVTGNIMRTDDGNQYLIIEDKSGASNDFPLNVHYQVNAYTASSGNMDNYRLEGHDYIVFEQDIHSESSFISVYSGFNIRTPGDAPLSGVAIFADNIQVTPERWYHITYVGDVSTGDAYLFLEGKCVAKVEGGLYNDRAIVDMAVYHGFHTLATGASTGAYSNDELAAIVSGLSAAQKSQCVNTMLLAGFRTMQVAGENRSGKNLTPGMSAASDNYYLRWVDGESDLGDSEKLSTLLTQIDSDYNTEDSNGLPDKTINGEYTIGSWGHNVYDSEYIENVLPDNAVIATINGVEYFDTTSINEALSDKNEYTTSLQEIVLYRNYIGNIIINCRATVTLNGVTSNVIVNTYDASTNPTGCTVENITDESDNVIGYNVYKQTPADGVQLPKMETAKTYKEEAATTSNIYTQWKSSKANNLYTSHAVGTATAANTVQISKFNSSTKAYAYDSSFPIYDKGAQVHTLNVGSSIAAKFDVSATSTMSTRQTTDKSSGIFNSTKNYGYTSTVTTTVTVTETLYYLVVEFDILSTDNSAKSVSISNVIDNKEYKLATDISSYLSDKQGEYIHVTIIGVVDASIGNIGATTTSTGSTSANASTSSTVNYSMKYKLYIDNVCRAETAELLGSTTAVANWNSLKISNSGNNISLSNVHISKQAVTNTYSHTTAEVEGAEQTGSTNILGSVTSGVSREQAQTDAAASAADAFNKNSAASTVENSELKNSANADVSLNNSVADPLGATKLDDCFSTPIGSSLDTSSGYGQTGDTPVVVEPADPEEETTYQDGTFEADFPIACVDGVLYYEKGAVDENNNPRANTLEVLQTVLQDNASAAKNVTFLREPTEPITISCNAVVDSNGLDVTYETEDCITKNEDGVTTVINMGLTDKLATVNDTDFSIGEEDAVQAAVDAADSVTVEFYNIPTKAISICCRATIDSNDLVDSANISKLFTTDINNYVVTANGSNYTIMEQIRRGTVEVRVVTNKNGSVETLATFKETADFGTDIAELLTEKGLMNGVFVINGTEVNLTSWDVTPSGKIEKEDSNGTSAYIYTATVDTENSKEITKKFAYVSGGVITESDSESDVRSWFSASGEGTIILNSDITFNNATYNAVNVSGDIKNVYLNGHTIDFETLGKSTDTSGVESGAGCHGFNLVNTAVKLNIHGEGNIDYMNYQFTQSLFFCNYSFTGKISLESVDITSSGNLATMRGGNLAMTECTVDAYLVNSASLFHLGEQYNGHTTNYISLDLRSCDFSVRHRTSTEVPLIRNITVTYTGNPSGSNYAVGDSLGKDTTRTVIIDGCNIKCGTLIQANEGAGWNTMSELEVYVNDSKIAVSALLKGGSVHPGSVLFYDNVRVSDDNQQCIAFATNLAAAKTSDGIYKVLYTSTDYVNIKWSNGETDIWATGSTPTNGSCRYDYITVDGLGVNQAETTYSATSNYPFKLFTNLTLSDVIGFNVYIPNTLKNGTAVSTSDVKLYIDGHLISANNFVGTSTVRESFVYQAKNNGFGDGYCYDYTYTFKPQDAAKTFTIVIVYKNTSVMSRTISVGDYILTLASDSSLSQKNKDLLKAAIAYIETATTYAGSYVNLDKITAAKSKLGTLSVAPAAPTLPGVSHSGTASDLSSYISGVQINVRGNCAFRFNLADGANASNFKFYVVNDAGDAYEAVDASKVTVGDGYIDLSLRAYEMARSIKIEYVDGGVTNYRLYSLYDYYTALSTLANSYGSIILNGTDTGFMTGEGFELTAAKKLVETIYTYASTCDKYLDRNVSEYEKQN